MTIHESLSSKIKEAMIAKDAVRVSVLRSISAACTNELVAKGKKPQEILEDEHVLAVCARLAKQRKDSIEQFRAGGREDLVLEEQEQLAILEEFLPKRMTQEEILPYAVAAQQELGITDPAKKGILMASIMKTLQGKADGTDVKTVVDNLF